MVIGFLTRNLCLGILKILLMIFFLKKQLCSKKDLSQKDRERCNPAAQLHEAAPVSIRDVKAEAVKAVSFLCKRKREKSAASTWVS